MLDSHRPFICSADEKINYSYQSSQKPNHNCRPLFYSSSQFINFQAERAIHEAGDRFQMVIER